MDKSKKYSHADLIIIAALFIVIFVPNLPLAGIELTFDSQPEQAYDILWTAELGGAWSTVTNVTAAAEKTTLVVPYPEGAESAGFFKVHIP